MAQVAATVQVVAFVRQEIPIATVIAGRGHEHVAGEANTRDGILRSVESIVEIISKTQVSFFAQSFGKRFHEQEVTQVDRVRGRHVCVRGIGSWRAEESRQAVWT